MGADMIGFILVGPHKLSKQAIKQGRTHLLKIRCIAQYCLDAGKIEELPKELEKYHDDVQFLTDEPEEQLKFFAECNDALLDDVINLWGGGARDVLERNYKDRRILACGEMSWGEGINEESGSAWTIQRACMCGLLDVLGLL